MSTGRETSTCRVTVRLNDQEVEALKEKMNQTGIRNMAGYFRKMALDGYILTLDIPELKEMISLMRYSSNNLNQIAKRVNGTGEIIETELKEVRDSQEKIWNGINRILKRLGEMP